MNTSTLTSAPLGQPSYQERAAVCPLLQAENISKRYPGAQTAVFKEVSLTLDPNSIASIIGPNGAGKSTLLRCCVRLIEPDTGSVFLGEQELTKLPQKQLVKARSQVGFVFQKHQLVGRMSVLSNVLHGALGKHSGPRYWSHRLARDEDRERAYECLQQVGLEKFSLRRADQLSGGQSQRVAIARVLMQQSKLIFADEPTASLDPRSGSEVLELLQQLCYEKELGVLMVSHDMEQTQQFSDRILGLKDGRLQLDAHSSDYTLPQLKRFFEA